MLSTRARLVRSHLAVFSFAFLFLLVNKGAGAEEIPPPELPEPPSVSEELLQPGSAPGTIEGVGTYFEVAGSAYLDVAVTSSEAISLRLESVPSTIFMDLEASTSANSTVITLSGLAPETTYYKYTDGFRQPETLVTDVSGSCTYTQDLSAPYLIVIQTTPSTIFLDENGWSQPNVGTWDPTTSSATLTTDIAETIQIDGDDITLDGGAHTVVGSGRGAGIAVFANRVTVKNLTVRGFSNGVLVFSATDTLITKVTATGNGTGIRATRSPYSNISENTVSGNTQYGIILSRSSFAVVTGNEVQQSGRYGIYVQDSSSATLTSNTSAANDYGIALRGFSDDAMISGNSILDNGIGLSLAGDLLRNHPISGCVVDGNDVLRSHWGVGSAAVSVGYADRAVVSDNNVSDSAYIGILISSTSESTVAGNIVSSNGDTGIFVTTGNAATSTGNALIRNATSDNGRWGLMIGSNTVDTSATENTADGNATGGIAVQRASQVVLSHNSASGSDIGITIGADGTTGSGNSASLNDYGIWLGSDQSSLSGSVVFGNTYGIYVTGGHNVVSDNTADGNTFGIYVYYNAWYNTIVRNRVSANAYGLGLRHYSGISPCENEIYNNDFVDNAAPVDAFFTCVNYLSQAPPVGGNYWSHHDTPDADGDGFVDTPYTAFYSSWPPGEAIDYWPHASPLGVGADNDGPLSREVALTPSVVEVGEEVVLVATVDDTESGGSDVASAESSIDAGAWLPMAAVDGAFDAPMEVVASSFYAPSVAGVYDVCVRGMDALGNVGEPGCTFLVAYDPSGGFVTGGGWIESPEGAYVSDPSLVGKASFGFVSKYKKGASAPTGSTEFQFKAAELNFRSTRYEWLVVAGASAKFKGEGTINGAGSYRFMLTARDGVQDTFRIRIWSEDELTAEETVFYDNGYNQVLGGGSVVIHGD